MRALLLLCTVVLAAAQLPANEVFSISITNGLGYAFYKKPTPMRIAPYTQRVSPPYPQFTFACDDDAAVYPSLVDADTIFNVTFNTYTGEDRSTCVALFPNGTIASYWRMAVLTRLLSVSGTTSGKVGEPLTVSVALLDLQGVTIPNPKESFTLGVLSPYLMTITPKNFGDYLIATFSWQFNSSWPALTFTFHSPGRYSFFNANFSVLPASGVAPSVAFTAASGSCPADRNCSLRASVYNFNTGLPTTWNGSIVVTSNGGSQVILPSGPVLWSNAPYLDFYVTFRNYTGYQESYALTITDAANPELTFTFPVYTRPNRVVFSVASTDVGVNETFITTMTQYADAGNTPVDGSRFQLQAYQSIDPYISGTQFTTNSTAYEHADRNGQLSTALSITVPGCYTVGTVYEKSPFFYVHPLVGGVLQPLPDFVIMPRDNTIYVDEKRSTAPLQFNVYYGANTSRAAIPGNVTISSSDPSWPALPTARNPSAWNIEGPFSVYTGNAGGLSITFTASANNASWTQTFAIKTFAWLNFEPVQGRVNPSQNISLTVYATRKNRTLLPQATERVQILNRDGRTGYYGRDDLMGGEIGVCKPMVNGRVSFQVSVCLEGLWQLTAVHCDFVNDYIPGTPSTTPLIIGNPPIIAKLGVAPLAPTPIQDAKCQALLGTTTSTASISTTAAAASISTTAAAVGNNTGGGVKWYIPVAAVLGALAVAVVVGVLVFVFVMKGKAKEDEYVVRG